MSRDHTDIRVLSLYAFNAFEQQRFGEAVAAWEMMLKLLPAGDVQNDAGNVEGWLMLGRTGMVLGNAGTATGAYANAYRLDPKNSDAALGYAEALTRSSDPEDNRRGGELLRQLVSRDHTDIRVLSLYAFSAFEQQRFGEAVAAWEMMLKLLPAGDARRAVIERSIRLAQEK